MVPFCPRPSRVLTGTVAAWALVPWAWWLCPWPPVLSLLQGTARGMGTALALASVRGKCCRPSRPPEVLSALPETSDWHAAPSTSLGGGDQGPHCGCRPGSSFNNKAAVLRLHALSLARLWVHNAYSCSWFVFVLLFCLFAFFFFLWPQHRPAEFPIPGTESMPPAWSLNYWTTWKSLCFWFDLVGQSVYCFLERHSLTCF